jgi:CubicO group peptidase (beta-lactamase class C family)
MARRCGSLQRSCSAPWCLRRARDPNPGRCRMPILPRKARACRRLFSGRGRGRTHPRRRHGKPVYFEAFGFGDPLARTPTTKDAIFRIYSMSNLITSVAVMMLLDRGKIALNDPR